MAKDGEPRQPSDPRPWLWLYSCQVSLVSTVIGIGLLYLGTDYFYITNILQPLQTLYIALLITGALLLLQVMALVLSSIPSLCTTERNTSPRESTLAGCHWSCGVVSLCFLLLCLLALLTTTCLLWWSSTQLAEVLEVRGPCLCSLDPPELGKPVVLDRRGICSTLGQGCTVVLTPQQVLLDTGRNSSGLLLSTLPCQLVDLGPNLDPVCLQYSAFLTVFLVLRVMLPALLTLLLPLLGYTCSSIKVICVH